MTIKFETCFNAYSPVKYPYIGIYKHGDEKSLVLVTRDECVIDVRIIAGNAGFGPGDGWSDAMSVVLDRITPLPIGQPLTIWNE